MSHAQRILAGLREKSAEMDEDVGMEFMASSVVRNVHNTPRFGHSNRVGQLASSQKEIVFDYAGGLKQFTLFVLIPFVLWGLVLLAFKFIYGKERVGCAAGGEILDVRALSKQGVKRKVRRQYIHRSWRVQASFMIAGIFVPTISIILMKLGWPHLETALQEVQDTLSDIESWSYKGNRILTSLLHTQNELQNHVFVKQAENSNVFREWCPRYEESEMQSSSSLVFLQTSFDSVQDTTLYLLGEYNKYVPSGTSGFGKIHEFAEQLDSSIDWFLNNDWKFKLFIMLLNVVSILLVMVVYIFSKNNIIHDPTRAFTTYFLLPALWVLTLCLMLLTGISGIAAVFNADFCQGGNDKSPQGTLKDAILSFEYGILDSNIELQGTMRLVYESFAYYSSGCMTDDPLYFLQDFATRIDEGAGYMTQLSSALREDTNNPDIVSTLIQECGEDLSFLPSTLESMEISTNNLKEKMHAFVDLTSCHRVSPMIRRMTHGAICDESAKGITWVWASCLCLMLCCFIMLTVRAGLFNSIKTRKPRDKKPRRVVEKEFEEYKNFMAEFYDPVEVAKWKLDDNKKKQKPGIQFDLTLLPAETFETEASTPDSEQGGIFDFVPNEGTSQSEPFKNDEESRASSYESCSDDSDSEEGDKDEQSAFLSFFTETKSMAVQALDDVKSSIGENVLGTSIMIGSDDDSRISRGSFWSEAGSLARDKIRHTVVQVRNMRHLLGSRQNDSALDKNDDSSLNDDSLFLFERSSPGAEEISLQAKWTVDTSRNKNRAQSAVGDTHSNISSKTINSRRSIKSRSTHDSFNTGNSLPLRDLPSTSSTNRAKTQGMWSFITPTSSSVIVTKLKTPRAPKKGRRFLTRTQNDSFAPNASRNVTGTDALPVRLQLSPIANNGETSPRALNSPRKRRHGHSQKHVSRDDSDFTEDTLSRENTKAGPKSRYFGPTVR